MLGAATLHPAHMDAHGLSLQTDRISMRNIILYDEVCEGYLFSDLAYACVYGKMMEGSLQPARL